MCVPPCRKKPEVAGSSKPTPKDKELQEENKAKKKKKKKTDTNSQDKFSGIHGTSRVEDLSTNVWGFNSSRDLFICIVVCLC